MVALFLITALSGPAVDLPAATRIASSYDWLCAITEGAIRCRTPMADRSVDLKGDFVDLAVGLGVCGRAGDGTIRCAALPRAPGKTAYAAPIAPAGRFTALFSHRRYACALDDTGRPRCFGEVMHDQGPHPTRGAPDTIVGAAAGCARVDDRWDCWPNALPDPKVAWTALAVGGSEVCGLTAKGAVECQQTAWRSASATPRTKAPRTGRFVRLQGDPEQLACALDAEGRATCFGQAFDYAGAVQPPAKVSFTRLVVDQTQACGLDKAGVAHCFGSIVKYDGTAPLKTPPPGPFVDLSIAADQMACGAQADGTVRCWGTSADPIITQQLGKGPVDGWAHATSTVCVLRSGRVQCAGKHTIEGTPAQTDFIRLGSTASVVCGLRKTGQIKCWGEAYNLEHDGFQPEPGGVADMRIAGLGMAFMRDGTIDYWTGGARVAAPDAAFKTLALSGDHLCGQTVDDGVTCWGGIDARWTGATVRLIGDRCVATTDGVRCLQGRAFKRIEHIKPGPVRALLSDSGETLVHHADGTVQHTNKRAQLPTARFDAVYANPGVQGFFCGLAAGRAQCWSTLHGPIEVALKGEYTALTMQKTFLCGLGKADGRVQCVGRATP